MTTCRCTERGTNTARHRPGTSLRSWPLDAPWARSFCCDARRHEGDRLHSPSGTRRQPEPAEPPLSRTILVLTQSRRKHQPGGIKHVLLRIQRRRPGHVCRWRSAACRLFFEGDAVAARKRESELRLVRMRRRRSSATSHKVRSGCSATRAIRAATSQRRTLPPRGFGAASALVPALQPLTDELTLPRNVGRLAPRRAHLHGFDHRSRRSTE